MQHKMACKNKLNNHCVYFTSYIWQTNHFSLTVWVKMDFWNFYCYNRCTLLLEQSHTNSSNCISCMNKYAMAQWYFHVIGVKFSSLPNKTWYTQTILFACHVTEILLVFSALQSLSSSKRRLLSTFYITGTSFQFCWSCYLTISSLKFFRLSLMQLLKLRTNCEDLSCI